MSSVLIADYEKAIAETDRLPEDRLEPVLLGLYGEVGSIMAIAKKATREGKAFPGYRRDALEEFGDALWYLARASARCGHTFSDILSDAQRQIDSDSVFSASDQIRGPIASIAVHKARVDIEKSLFALGAAAAGMFPVVESHDMRASLVEVARSYLVALVSSEFTLAEVVAENLKKVESRFKTADVSSLPLFDDDFGEEEQLPRRFSIRINERKSGKSYLQINNVFIGDPLTDNISDPDGYRFHDVFHLAHAAILGWSPVFRALLKHKRKSESHTDEAQDGGRAIVVEEGLTAWIFSRSKELDFFEGHSSLSFDFLKTVQQFVAGYEVSECPLSLWERAILDGYRVFRQVRQEKGGWIDGCLTDRTITFRSLESES